MPPGWSHTGDHKMSGMVRKKYFEELSNHTTDPIDQPVAEQQVEIK
jgi:hypothetical protein